ncbi:MAG: helix-turn-helix domain-containing protein [Flavobacteriales bacterium]
MEFYSFNSEHPQLKGIIDSYYFHFDENNKEFSFSFYPNYQNAITVYRGSKKIKLEKGSHTVPAGTDEMTILYTKNFYSKQDVLIQGPFDKLGIVFHPLGLNHFFEENIGAYIRDQVNEFNYWGDEFEQFLKSVFAKKNWQQRVEMLDDYFANRIVGFPQQRLKEAVQLIIDSKGDIRVEEIADVLKVSRKTLLRDFRMHMSCTVEEYRKMVKFRFALDRARKEGIDSLTQLALEHNYYDQADFNKQFKGLSSESPARLLRSLSTIGKIVVKKSQ